MTDQNPGATTWGDLCTAALQDCGRLGIGMIPLAEDLSLASDRGMWMLQQWERRRWFIYTLETYMVTSTGQSINTSNNQLQPYTIGPTGADVTPPQISVGTWPMATRPNRLESVFFRQLINSPPNGPIDFPLVLVPSMEDYNQIRLKGLTNWSLAAFYQPSWPYGKLFPWPWPQANVYALGITIRAQLPQAFSTTGNSLAVKMNIPFEYYEAIVSNLAIILRARYGIATWPGDPLPMRARAAIETLRAGNTAVANLDIPPWLTRGGIYDVFSDTNY